MENKKKIYRRTELALVAIVLLVCTAILVIMCADSKRQAMEGIRNMSSGWYYMENGQKNMVTFPAKIIAREGEDLVLYNDGITAEDAGRTVTTEGAQYNPVIRMNDQIIYQYNDSSFRRNTQMKAKLNCDGVIPANTRGGILTLTYSSPDRGYFEISGIYMGTGSAVTMYHVVESMPAFIVAVCFILLGIIAVLIAGYLSCRQMPDARFLDVALFLFMCGIWLVTDSSLIQTYSSNANIISVVSFYTFMLLAVPMLHFAQRIGNMKKYRILELGIYLFYFNAGIQGILNYFGIFEFVDMLFFTHILLVIWVFVSAFLLCKEYRENPGRELKMVATAYGMVSASGILALLLYWMLEISYYDAIFEIGILVFLAIVIADTVINMAGNVRYLMEQQTYERLSSEDWMTGMPNRAPFENMLTEIQNQASRYQDILLIFMDINHLRRANEESGRAAGDELIITMARCIMEIFGTQGKCYRIGGDEFAVIVFNPEKDAELFLAEMDREIYSFNKNSRHRLTVARGYSLIRDEDGNLKTISEWKYEADEALYQNKRKGGRTGGSL